MLRRNYLIIHRKIFSAVSKAMLSSIFHYGNRKYIFSSIQRYNKSHTLKWKESEIFNLKVEDNTKLFLNIKKNNQKKK